MIDIVARYLASFTPLSINQRLHTRATNLLSVLVVVRVTLRGAERFLRGIHLSDVVMLSLLLRWLCVVVNDMDVRQFAQFKFRAKQLVQTIVEPLSTALRLPSLRPWTFLEALTFRFILQLSIVNVFFFLRWRHFFLL